MFKELRHWPLAALLCGFLVSAPAALAQKGRPWVDPPADGELRQLIAPKGAASEAPPAEAADLDTGSTKQPVDPDILPATGRKQANVGQGSQGEAGMQSPGRKTDMRRVAGRPGASRPTGARNAFAARPRSNLFTSLFGPPRSGANVINTYGSR